MKPCVDCIPGSKRPAPHPGPRCHTHHRTILRARRQRAHELMVQKVYGLAQGQYDRLYELQGRKCAICQRATGKTRKLAVDHDHKTGLVRGLLCGVCNRLLGHLRDDPIVADRIAAYLRNPPAASLHR